MAAVRTKKMNNSSFAVNEFVLDDKTSLPVRVRVSSRAKRLRLTLDFTGQLEVVVPKHLSKKMGISAKDATKNVAGSELHAQLTIPFSPDTSVRSTLPAKSTLPAPIQDFLEQHRHWIEDSAKRSKPQRESYRESRAAGLPTHLDFPFCDEIWLVEYQPTQAQSITVRPDGLRRIQGTCRVFSLRLSGATANEELCRRALIRFVTQHAKEAIPRFAQDICREMNASPKSITVNNRKSAWGICTRNGDIRIDRRVMFLPRDLVRQIVLHEIAHLKFLNHSQSFYDELYSYEGSTKEAEKAVKSAVRYVPAWFVSGYNQVEPN